MKNKLILFIFTLSSFLGYTQNEDIKDTSRIVEQDAIPTINISESELEADEMSQDISALLTSSKDVFVSTAGYTFGSARYRTRGLDSKNTTVMMDGIIMNDMERGRAYWSQWGGLNDAVRNSEINYGITPCDYTFGGIGGNTNIITRASQYRKGTKFTYSNANRSYRNRIMLISSTGLMKNNMAITFSGSRRWAQEGYVEGTFYDAWSYFLAIEKVLNDKHSLNITVFGAPKSSGKPGFSTQEAYDLSGTNYYNPYWGIQNGEVRNSRVSTYNQPRIMLNHYWKLSEDTKIQTGFSTQFGRGGSTALNWYDASHPTDPIDEYVDVLDPGYHDPRPDYYRYLPSYWDGENDYMYDQLTDEWQNNEQFRQLNFDYFYFANRKNLYTVDNADGIAGNTVSGNRSKYIIEERRSDLLRYDFSSTLKHHVNDNFDISGGINATIYKSFHYNILADLLGGDYWLDIDKYAERDYTDNNLIQTDLNNPNEIIKEGDRFGYDYNANINKALGFVNMEYTFGKIDLYWAANLSFTQFWRTGNVKTGLFPDNSYGDSDKNSFLNYGTKLGATYKFNGKHFIKLNGAYLTRAPYFSDAYVSPRTRDNLVDNLESEQLLSGDASYIMREKYVKLRVTGYYTSLTNSIYNKSFYHDELNTFVNYVMTGVDELYTGGEFSLEAKITSELSIVGMAGMGSYIYNSRPSITITQDNNTEVLAQDRTAFIKNYKVGGYPQTVASIGVKYWSQKYWFVGANINYMEDIYLSINPDRRTAEALQGKDTLMQGIVTSDPLWNEMLDQKKLDGGYTVDCFVGKSWRFKYKYYVNVSLNISNVLDNQDLAIGGFEQFRYDRKDMDKFPPKMFYLYGRQYFLNINFSF